MNENEHAGLQDKIKCGRQHGAFACTAALWVKFQSMYSKDFTSLTETLDRKFDFFKY